MRALATVLSLSVVCALTTSGTSAFAVATGPEETALIEGLVLHVREEGPNRPWLIAIENQSEHAVSLVKDPRLLSLKVKVPGKRKEVDCQLPGPMRPHKAEQERLRRLDPGEEMRFRIDPRFYCFDGDEGVLVPGAMIEATYGFEGATKTTRRGGRTVTERLPSTPPYVAQFLPIDDVEDDPSAHEDDDDDHESAEPDDEDLEDLEDDEETSAHDDDEETGDDDEPSDAEASGQAESQDKQSKDHRRRRHGLDEHDPDAPGLRHLESIRLALGSEYSSWNPPSSEEDERTRGLRLEVIDGSDSLTARGAQVTVRLTNGGHRSQKVFIRRELISFYLLGPDGLSLCAAAPEERAPDSQGFTILPPGKHTTLATRLVEFCPGDIIDRPGFYLVAAELDAKSDANEDVDAFEGVLFTTRGKPVRIQKGELPFVYRDVPRRGFIFERSGGRHGKSESSSSATDSEGSVTTDGSDATDADRVEDSSSDAE